MALIKRGDHYYLRLRIGGTRYFRSTGFSDLRRAKTRANEIESELREGKGTRTCPTLETWWRKYSETYSAAKGAGGQKLDKRAIPPALAIWGPKRRLSSISSADCHQWKQERAQRVNSNTLRTEQGVLAAFFRAAVAEGFLSRSPFVGVRRARAIPRQRVLSLEEQARLLPCLLPHHRRAVQVLLGTGLRISELLALRPSHISPSGLQVMGKGKKHRVVPLTAEVRTLLSFATGRADSRLFPLTDRAMLEALQRGCVRAKIPLLTLHDLRRTFGTRCAEKLPMPRLAKIMGHSSIQTTAQFYVHLDAADARDLERVNLLGSGADILPFEKSS